MRLIVIQKVNLMTRGRINPATSYEMIRRKSHLINVAVSFCRINLDDDVFVRAMVRTECE
jgi:hypothetical protein